MKMKEAEPRSASPTPHSRLKVQVFVFGHQLRGPAKRWLRERYGDDVRIVPALYHAERLEHVAEAATEVVSRLVARGADFSGRTRTLIVAPGLSVGVAAILAVLHGVLGEFPELLVIGRFGPDYIPCPEQPVINLQDLRNASRKLREQTMTEQAA